MKGFFGVVIGAAGAFLCFETNFKAIGVIMMIFAVGLLFSEADDDFNGKKEG